MESNNHYKSLIIGAGPAGMQMAFFLQQRDEAYVILEGSEQAGNFFNTYPTHRQLISINKRHTGYEERDAQLRFDWNSLLCDDDNFSFTDYCQDYFPPADYMVQYSRDYADKYQLNIQYKTLVTHITKSGDKFVITTAQGDQYSCDRLFVGTGLYTENIPNIEGIELCKTYGTASVDPNDYLDKRVMIFGKSNSAFEFADNLVETTRKISLCSPRHVRLAWATHYVGNVRAVNNNFIDTYLLKSQNNILDGVPEKIFKQGDELIARVYFESRKRSFDFPCDEVVFCTGFKFNTDMFAENYKPDMTPCGKLPTMDASWQSTNIDNLYFIGTLMQMRDYHKTMSGFIHGFRHNIEALDQILDDRSFWRKTDHVPFDLDKLTDKIMQRISRAAAIFLQPGFLGDIFWLDSRNGNVTFWHDVPFEYVRDQGFFNNHVFTISLEYKPCNEHMDPLNMPRGLGVAEDFYLHPIIREYSHGKCINRLFLADDLDNDWLILPEHRQSLRQQLSHYFSNNEQLAGNL